MSPDRAGAEAQGCGLSTRESWLAGNTQSEPRGGDHTGWRHTDSRKQLLRRFMEMVAEGKHSGPHPVAHGCGLSPLQQLGNVRLHRIS